MRSARGESLRFCNGMKVFSIGDLHLSGGMDKPMDVFGESWRDHAARIFDAWRERVGRDDCVLMPGDFCWAMQLRDALPELQGIAELPGKKALVRGNHDYWWSSPTRMRELVDKSITFIQNDAADMGEFIVCGTRGWSLPGAADFGANDEKIYARELIRLEMSLAAARRLSEAPDCGGKPVIAMLHFPPLLENGAASGFTDIIEAWPVHEVVYGHLHGASCRLAFEGVKNGVRYTLCSADHIGFAPKLIAEL